MSRKRQNQIQVFLLETFGEKRGRALFARQEEWLGTLLKKERNKSKRQMKTLAQTILPSIALYQVLQADGVSQADAYASMQRYMLDKVAAEKHASMVGMEAIPGFYALYSTIFLSVMRTADLWESRQTRSRGAFDVTIQKCLWQTACAENGCTELCRLFCDADNVTYGGLKKIGFTRTKSLGCGGDRCDFHFFRK